MDEGGSGGGKTMAEVQSNIDELVENIFETLKLGPEDSVSRTDCSRVMFQLMKGHGYDDAWDNDEFNRLYDLF